MSKLLMGTAGLSITLIGAIAYLIWLSRLQDQTESTDSTHLASLADALTIRDLNRVVSIAGKLDRRSPMRQVAVEAAAGRWEKAQQILFGYPFQPEIADLKRSGPGPRDSDFEGRELREGASRSEQVYRLYHGGDYQAAKEALLAHLDYLDGIGANRPDLYSMAQNDAMISYVRLAKLEEKYNGRQGAEFMRLASARCEELRLHRMPLRDCSAELLRRNVDKVDRVPPSPAAE